MCAFQLFLSVDPSLGRVDCNALSDQTLMELLIDGFDEEAKKEYQDNDGMYLDICKWSCIECDDDERVVKIDIESSAVIGSLELCYVPPKAQLLSISSYGSSKLTGSIDVACLPNGMSYLSLSNNQLTGKINLTQLPGGMDIL